MTKFEIIEKLAREQQVEKIVYKLLANSKNPFDVPEDLIQDVYLLLLDKENTLIEDLFIKNELGYYLLKIVKNLLFSTNSPYYYTYIKFKNQSEGIESAENILTEDRG